MHLHGNFTHDTFISYSHQDKAWVMTYLVPGLRDAGLEVLVDYDGFREDDYLIRNIDEIAHCKKTLAILSPDYIDSKWCKHEFDLSRQLSVDSENTHAVIPINYKDWDHTAIPKRYRTSSWLDFTGPEGKEYIFKKLIALIKGEELPLYSPNSHSSSETPSLPPGNTIPSIPTSPIVISETPPKPLPTHYIVPLDKYFPLHPLPSGLKLPPSYDYLGQHPDLTDELFYRVRDGHVAVRFPGRDGQHLPFLIDKYAITNMQFCTFLNDLLTKKRAVITTLAGRKVICCNDSEGHLLAADANGYWKERQKVTHPWGITYINATWQPLAGCALLPVTLVSWQGAYLYSLWAHDVEDRPPHSCLPTAQQWRDAAQFNPTNGERLSYPWGNTWQRTNVYFVGNSATGEIRPQPVSSLEKGHSPIGCVQLIGNTWEWCADSPPGQPERHKIKGGACNSPQKHCTPLFEDSTIDITEYIGFRCFFSLPD